MKLTEATLEAQRMVPSDTEVRNLCLDKGYDYNEVLSYPLYLLPQ